MHRKIPARGCSQVPGKDLEAPQGRAICHGCHAPRGTAGAADLSSQLLLSFMGLQGKKTGKKGKKNPQKNQESSYPPADFGVSIGSRLQLLMFSLPLPQQRDFSRDFLACPAFPNGLLPILAPPAFSKPSPLTPAGFPFSIHGTGSAPEHRSSSLG